MAIFLVYSAARMIDAVLFVIWSVLCGFLYVWRYVKEQILDLPITGQSPCTAHASLKSLLQRFKLEAEELPRMQKLDEDHPAVPDDSNVRTYEDLLSTAIINKVVENYQNNDVVSNSSRRSNKEYFLGERNLDDNSSVSSLDEWSTLQGARGKKKYGEQVLKQRIEEATSSDDETKDEDEAVSVTKDAFWQENWYLQKRKYNGGTNSPVPVPMLVPNPTIEAKVLIGDRDAEDTTDLSDADDLEEEAIEPTSLNSVLLNSKHVIGGAKSALESVISTVSEDGSTDVSDLLEERNEIFDQMKAIGDQIELDRNILNEEKRMEDASLLSLDSNTEKDSEYTEKYATVPRIKFLGPPIPAPRQSKTYEHSIEHDDKKTETADSGVTSDEDDKKHFIGSYSEREKQKWNHPVEIENNPYSESNLIHRLSKASSKNAITNLLERDAIIRSSAKSSATKSSAFDPEVSLSTIEESYAHNSLPRRLFRAKNASKQFVTNPLMYFSDDELKKLEN